MNYLYILKSIKDGKHYVGITSDLNKRLKYHNDGLVKSTKNRIPFVMIYNERFHDMKEARVRERYLKSYGGSVEKKSIIDSVSK